MGDRFNIVATTNFAEILSANYVEYFLFLNLPLCNHVDEKKVPNLFRLPITQIEALKRLTFFFLFFLCIFFRFKSLQNRHRRHRERLEGSFEKGDKVRSANQVRKSDYYNESSYTTVYYRFAPYTRVNVTLSFHLLLYFLLFSVFSFLSFSITYLVIPYGRTDGRRGLSKLLLHGTRENRNTPENSPLPFSTFYELAVDSLEKSLHCLISRLLRRVKFFYSQVEI